MLEIWFGLLCCGRFVAQESGSFRASLGVFTFFFLLFYFLVYLLVPVLLHASITLSHHFFPQPSVSCVKGKTEYLADFVVALLFLILVLLSFLATGPIFS
jgi:hypothetical protein